MKNKYLLPSILFVLIIVVTLVCRLFPRTVPFDQCSSIYQRYALKDGIDASFIKAFKINDSLCIDVTLLETTDSSIFESLCQDFDIAPLSLIPKEYLELIVPKHTFELINGVDTLVAGGDTLYKKNLIVFSRRDKTLSVFHQIDDEKYDAILNKNFKEIQ